MKAARKKLRGISGNGGREMSEGAYYCPRCQGLMIVIKALFMPGILRARCFNCGFDGYFRVKDISTWRKRDE